MPRCGCASDRCSCYIVEGENVSVTGAGTQANPFVISAATTVVDISGVPQTPTGGGRMTGEIIEYGGTTAPSGWLICDGSAVSRTVYAALYAVLGTSRGAGDGTTTFNLPNKTDRVTIGASGSRPRGTKGGAETHTMTTAQMPAHTHTINHTHAATSSTGSHDHPLSRSTAVGGSNSTIPLGTGTIDRVDAGGAVGASGAHTHTIPAYTGASGSVGTGDPINHMPPYEASIFLIKT